MYNHAVANVQSERRNCSITAFLGVHWRRRTQKYMTTLCRSGILVLVISGVSYRGRLI